MLNPAHLLEVAFLLLGAFLVGASVGSLARIVMLRAVRPKAASSNAEVPAAPVETAPAPVAAPVIEPVANPAIPAAPANVPVPDFSGAVEAVASPVQSNVEAMSAIRMPTLSPLPALATTKPKLDMAPAHVAGQTTSGQLVASPHPEGTPPTAVAANGVTAEVIPFPAERVVTPSIEEVAAAASTEATDDAQGTEVTEVGAYSAEGAAGEPEALPADSQPTSGEETSEEPDLPMQPAQPVAVAEPEPALAPAASSADDEAAAMRAIEGNWSPKRGAANGLRKVAMPEGVDTEQAVASAGAAVTAAAEAVKALVAGHPTENPAGKPPGIAAPRQGVKDNLTNVIGVLPIIETALNNLGVYHFDQIAEFSDENVTWLEEHLGIGGRIGREHWREQARELAVVSERARKVAGQP